MTEPKFTFKMEAPKEGTNWRGVYASCGIVKIDVKYTWWDRVRMAIARWIW